MINDQITILTKNNLFLLLLILLIIINNIIKINCDGETIKTTTFIPGMTIKQGDLDISYHASLKKVNKITKESEHFCEGVIISEINVLTQTKCKKLYENMKNENDKKKVKPYSYYVSVGVNDDDNINDEIHIDIKTICKPNDDIFGLKSTDDFENKSKKQFFNNIALIVLKKSFQFNKNINPVIISDNNPSVNSDCIVTAWNKKGRLKAMKTKIFNCNFDNTEIEKIYKPEQLICTLPIPDKFSGGPLVCNKQLVGISTSLVDLIPENTGDEKIEEPGTSLYYSTSFMKDWIEKNLNKKSKFIDADCSDDGSISWYYIALIIVGVAILTLCAGCICLYLVCRFVLKTY